jgi:hypothetical protein
VLGLWASATIEGALKGGDEVEPVQEYPLIFTYRHFVKGSGFFAEVCSRGRALMVKEEDGWWMNGVQPGGLAEGGETFKEAHARFRDTFHEILVDIAYRVQDFDSFKAEIQSFVNETNELESKDWCSAVSR